MIRRRLLNEMAAIGMLALLLLLLLTFLAGTARAAQLESSPRLTGGGGSIPGHEGTETVIAEGHHPAPDVDSNGSDGHVDAQPTLDQRRRVKESASTDGVATGEEGSAKNPPSDAAVDGQAGDARGHAACGDGAPASSSGMRGDTADTKLTYVVIQSYTQTVPASISFHTWPRVRTLRAGRRIGRMGRSRLAVGGRRGNRPGAGRAAVIGRRGMRAARRGRMVRANRRILAGHNGWGGHARRGGRLHRSAWGWGSGIGIAYTDSVRVNRGVTVIYSHR